MNDSQEESSVTSNPAVQSGFRAFISYRRLDAGGVARWLRNRLVGYTLPKELLDRLSPELRQAVTGRRSYYLDTAYAKANENFWDSNIEPALQRSEYLIVISSPAAFECRPDGSENWVAREIARFHAIHNNPRRIKLALAAGASENDFPGRLGDISKQWDWADFRGYASALWRWINLPRALKLDDEFIKIVAGIFDIPPDLLPVLKQEETRRRLRRVRTWIAGLLVVVGVVVGLAVWAEVNRQEAVAQQLRLIASRALQIAENDPMSGLALALERVAGGEHVPRLPEVIRSLVQPLHDSFEVALIAREPHFATTVDQGRDDPRRPLSAAFDLTGHQVATVSLDGSVRMWDAATGHALPGFGRSPTDDNDPGHRHGDLVFSRTRLATSFRQGPLDLWDIGNGSHIASLDQHFVNLDRNNVWVERLAFSIKMQMLVVLLTDGRIGLFDENGGALRGEIASGATFDDQCWNSSLDADATVLATCSGPNTVAIWDLERRTLRRAVRHPGLSTFVLSANGDRLATADRDGHAVVWDTRTGQRVASAVLERKNAESLRVDQLRISPDAKWLLIVSNETAIVYDAFSGTAKFWLDDASVATEFGLGETWRTFAFSPDGQSLAEARADGVVRHWALSGDLRGSARLSRMKGHLNRVTGVGFSPDSKFVLSVSLDGTVRIWDPSLAETWQKPMAIAQGATPWSENATPLVFAKRGGVAEFFDWRGGRVLAGSAMDRDRAASARFVQPPAFLSDDHRLLAVFNKEKNLVVWSTPDQRELASISIDGEEPQRLAVDATGGRAAILTDRCTVYVAPMTQSGAAAVWHAPKSNDPTALTCDVAVAATTGKFVAAISLPDSSQIHLIDLETRTEIGLLEGDTDPITRISIAPSGTWLAGLGQGGSITIWSLRERKVLQRLADKAQHVFVAWGPNGRIAVGRQFGGTVVWDLSTGKQIAVLSGHTFGSNAAAFSSDGRLLIDASGGGNKGVGGSVIVWDLESGQPLQKFKGLPRGVEGLAISRDGTRFIAYARYIDEDAFIGRPVVHIEEARAEALKRISRCLTPEQRETLFLPREAPAWCRGKWPYLSWQ